jgi:uncharacterized protein YdeI (YjbR/CyaY-like superfamily)
MCLHASAPLRLRTTVQPRGPAAAVSLDDAQVAAIGGGAPDALASALDGAPGARTAFDPLSYIRRKELARGVAEAKRPETREKRIAETVALLQG